MQIAKKEKNKQTQKGKKERKKGKRRSVPPP